MRRTGIRRWVLAAIFTLPTIASADEAPLHRFQINVGAFFVTSVQTTAAVAKSQGPIDVGTLIDFNQDLSVSDRETVGRIDGFYRFTKRSRIDFSYWDIKRHGTATAPFDIEFGNIFIPAGTPLVDSSIDQKTYKVDYGFSFYNEPKIEVGVSAGLHWTSASIGLSAPPINTSETVSGPIPLPVIGLYLRYNITRRWRLVAKSELFALSYQNWSGSLSDILATVEQQTWKRAGFGFGLNRISFNLKGASDTLRGSFENTVMGYEAYVFATFGNIKR
jgi:hypothetical protein